MGLLTMYQTVHQTSSLQNPIESLPTILVGKIRYLHLSLENRLSKVKQFPHCHTASGWWTQDLNTI